MSEPDLVQVIREFFENNATVPAVAVFNVLTWQEVSEDLAQEIEHRRPK